MAVPIIIIAVAPDCDRKDWACDTLEERPYPWLTTRLLPMHTPYMIRLSDSNNECFLPTRKKWEGDSHFKVPFFSILIGKRLLRISPALHTKLLLTTIYLTWVGAWETTWNPLDSYLVARSGLKLRAKRYPSVWFVFLVCLGCESMQCYLDALNAYLPINYLKRSYLGERIRIPHHPAIPWLRF
ncbi:uncharacterized protein An05g00580 [Aspergillus niger]|uniref:Contig An05c0020, genomic contig n=2 Tax=Aspergillus niger TaxID=5061 RepID=A2QKL0_ASPNC|nr:uncharacterized protein An05g00580 [Aspergillus niger]CAK39093.1 unnamed protein product [Aspergillus niger]